MDYSSLTGAKTSAGSIKRWINDTSLDIDAILEEAQALIYGLLRVREMRSEIVLNAVSGDLSIALPTGFLDPMALKDLTNLIDFDLNTPSEIHGLRVYESLTVISAIPMRYAIWEEALQFECRYDSNATLSMLYFKTPTALSLGNPTNFLTARYPHLVRTACVAAGQDFLNHDAEYDRQMKKLAGLIETINSKDDFSYRGLV